eukprot:scaffold13842_cov115-Isochrysis_galbana.AAC.2
MRRAIRGRRMAAAGRARWPRLFWEHLAVRRLESPLRRLAGDRCATGWRRDLTRAPCSSAHIIRPSCPCSVVLVHCLSLRSDTLPTFVAVAPPALVPPPTPLVPAVALPGIAAVAAAPAAGPPQPNALVVAPRPLLPTLSLQAVCSGKDEPSSITRLVVLISSTSTAFTGTATNGPTECPAESSVPSSFALGLPAPAHPSSSITTTPVVASAPTAVPATQPPGPHALPVVLPQPSVPTPSLAQAVRSVKDEPSSTTCPAFSSSSTSTALIGAAIHGLTPEAGPYPCLPPHAVLTQPLPTAAGRTCRHTPPPPTRSACGAPPAVSANSTSVPSPSSL